MPVESKKPKIKTESKLLESKSVTLKVTVSILFSLLLLLIFWQESQKRQNPSINQVKEVEAEVLVTTPGPILEVSRPNRLVIPKIKLDTNFTEPLGLTESGEVGVPDTYTDVGWYKYSPTPGALGPAVILGHVDSYTGPAVFFSLGQLSPGDDIFVDREDGSRAHFQVMYFERYEQVEFPTEKVYGNIDYAGLRLITCTGTFDKGKQRYSHNLVVYAKLVE